MSPVEREELRRLGEELRAVFARERTAIGQLDHDALATVYEAKQRLVTELGKLRANASTRDPELRALFAAIRVEAHATALLANHANHAINALLGRETSGYDKRANRTMTAGPSLRSYRY
ncbi:MAG TPA: hypothetical protein VGG28_26170 [Kofleriaceae bacterium]|jgi:hypothetical protein